MVNTLLNDGLSCHNDDNYLKSDTLSSSCYLHAAHQEIVGIYVAFIVLLAI